MKILPISIVLALGLSSSLLASPITFTGTSGDLSATAEFKVQGSDLIVTLTNTSAADVTNPSQVLTALFFDVAGNPVLTPLNAVLAPGSTVINGPTPSTNPSPDGVGGEWGLAGGLSGAPLGANYGISSSGLGLFGDANFPGNNLQGPNANPPYDPTKKQLDGVQYGITSAGDNPATGNGGIAGQGLIKNAVVFTIGGFSGNPALDISNVSFQYGTSLTEPNIPSVPEVTTILLALAGFGGTGRAGLRRKARK